MERERARPLGDDTALNLITFYYYDNHWTNMQLSERVKSTLPQLHALAHARTFPLVCVCDLRHRKALVSLVLMRARENGSIIISEIGRTVGGCVQGSSIHSKTHTRPKGKMHTHDELSVYYPFGGRSGRTCFFLPLFQGAFSSQSQVNV